MDCNDNQFYYIYIFYTCKHFTFEMLKGVNSVKPLLYS